MQYKMNPVPYYPPKARRPVELMPEEGAERAYGPRPQHTHCAMAIAWLLLQGLGLLPLLLWKGPVESYLGIFPPVLLVVSFFVCLLANWMIGTPVYRHWPREGPCWHPLVMVAVGGFIGMVVVFVTLVVGFFCGGFLYLIAGQGFGEAMWLVGIGGPLAGGALTGAVWAWIVSILDRRWLRQRQRLLLLHGEHSL